MKLIYINYSDINYRQHQNNLIEHVLQNKLFDAAIPYTREWLEQSDFYKQNKKILDKDRLAGYAIWKPYIILEAFNHVEENDVIVYMDCGDIPYPGISECIKEYMKQHDQYFIAGNHTTVHKWYTKRDCFYYMNCDSEKYWNAIQLEDGFMAFKKTEYNVHLLNEFLKYCCDERIATDIPNQCGLDNLEGFKDHRHDQSIITNLQLKYDLPRVEGHTGIRNYIQWNVLLHKDGENYSNGSYDWGETGCIA